MRVVFALSDASKAEVDDIVATTDLQSVPEVYRRAFTLLRIHLEAARQGHTVYIQDPDTPLEKTLVVLPFRVDPK